MPDPVRQDTPAHEHAGGCFVRLAWMLFSNLILMFSVVSIIRNGESLLSTADAIFWATVVAAIGLRYIDISRLRGLTAEGQPATMAHWRRYSIVLPAIALIVWIIAHAVAQVRT